MQTGTKDAVAATHSGAVKVELSSQKTARAGQALDEILTAVLDTVRQVGDIASASQQVAGGARSVTDTRHSISAVVEESSAATEEMAAQASAVSGAISSIAAVSEQQSAATEQVSASIEQMSAHQPRRYRLRPSTASAPDSRRPTQPDGGNRETGETSDARDARGLRAAPQSPHRRTPVRMLPRPPPRGD